MTITKFAWQWRGYTPSSCISCHAPCSVLRRENFLSHWDCMFLPVRIIKTCKICKDSSKWVSVPKFRSLAMILGTRQPAVALRSFFYKHGPPWSPFHSFLFFQTNFTIFTWNIREKTPSSIRCRDSNPRPSVHESPPPINTRSELPPDIKKFYDVGPFRRDDEKWKSKQRPTKVFLNFAPIVL